MSRHKYLRNRECKFCMAADQLLPRQARKKGKDAYKTVTCRKRRAFGKSYYDYRCADCGNDCRLTAREKNQLCAINARRGRLPRKSRK